MHGSLEPGMFRPQHKPGAHHCPIRFKLEFEAEGFAEPQTKHDFVVGSGCILRILKSATAGRRSAKTTVLIMAVSSR